MEQVIIGVKHPANVTGNIDTGNDREFTIENANGRKITGCWYDATHGINHISTFNFIGVQPSSNPGKVIISFHPTREDVQLRLVIHCITE